MSKSQTEKQTAPSNGLNAQKRSTTNSPQTPYHSDDQSKFAITIGAPVAEVFSFFRDFTNLPSFMKDLKSIEVLSSKKSHWVVEINGGFKAEWDAEITAERPGEMISWKSVEGSQVESSGSVYFRPAPEGRGAVVSLTLDYALPGGKITEIITALTCDNPEELANVNLRRLKGFLETGVIATTEGQPSGRDADAETIKH